VNDKFDELAKSMAQSVTRRAALKKFGAGFAAIALAMLGLANKAEAKHFNGHCNCHKAYFGCDPTDLACRQFCVSACGP
jgi:hypothetical protein